MEKTFRKNLTKFQRYSPVEAFHFRSYGAMTKGPLPDNLEKPYGKLFEPDRKEEARKWFASLLLEGVSVVYVFGVGFGDYYEALKLWLKEDGRRHAVFFEDDPEVFFHFLRCPAASEQLDDPQVSTFFIKDLKEANTPLDSAYWMVAREPILITGLKSYIDKRKQAFSEVQHRIAYNTEMKNALLEEYLQLGIPFFKNFYPNILRLHSAKWGNALFGKFEGVPAIITGAGPSLEKQLTHLKALEGKAIIFAGGSSLNALLSANVRPDFGAGIDPNPAQLDRLEKTTGQKIPFFFRPRMHHPAFLKIDGEKLYISGAGGYEIANFYEAPFHIEGELLDEGHNVVNFLTEIAERMGCNPIIYVGMDLAFTGGKTYAGGIVEKQKLSDAEKKASIKRQDIFGNRVLTLWKWVAEAEWIASFAKEHPETSFFNATEGGNPALME